MTGRSIVVAVLVCAVGAGLVLRATPAMPESNGAPTVKVCGRSAEELAEMLDWGEFNRVDATSLSQAEEGGLGSTYSSVDATIGFLVRAADYVVRVEVVEVGEVRYNTPTGQPASVADGSTDVDSLLMYAPVLFANHQVLQPADAVGQICGFIAPVWLPNSVHDKASASLLASRLTPGLQSIAFLNSVRPGPSLPWLSFLELHHYTLATRVGVDVPMALVGAFFPIDGDNVIGYRGGAMPADRFSEMVADEVASLK